MIKNVIVAVASALFLLPGLASAQFLLDTGTPTNFTTPDVVSSSSALGVEFSLTAGQNLQDISLYLTPGTGNDLNQFLTVQLFSANITSRNHAGAIDSFQLQYTASGWNTVAANFAAPSTGDYWLTVQTATSGYTFDAPGLGTQPTGTAPALAFAFASNGASTYTASLAATFGVQVGIAAVPEPSSWALALLCVGSFVYLRRRSLRA